MNWILAFLSLAACAPAADGGPSTGPLPGNHTEIGRIAGQSRIAHYCGGIGYVDLGAAVDGPAYYFRKADGRIIARCGGHCDGEAERCATECPPPEWNCR
jgi:hypothetical protein